MTETLQQKIDSIFFAYEYINEWHIQKAIQEFREQIETQRDKLDSYWDIEIIDAYNNVLALIGERK